MHKNILHRRERSRSLCIGKNMLKSILHKKEYVQEHFTWESMFMLFMYGESMFKNILYKKVLE